MQDVVDQTKIAALPDHGDRHKELSSSADYLDVNAIPAFLEQPDKTLKVGVRSKLNWMSVNQVEERASIWRGVFVNKEGGGEDKAEANAGLYWETVKTCFGNQGKWPYNNLLNLMPYVALSELPSEPAPTPSILEPQHMNNFCLKPKGGISVSRILTCFAYNSPDIQYCPHSYPIAAVIRHYLSEEDTYGLLCALAASRQPKYFPQSKLQHDIEWRTVMDLNKEYNVRARIKAARLCFYLMGNPSDFAEKGASIPVGRFQRGRLGAALPRVVLDNLRLPPAHAYSQNHGLLLD